MVLRGCVWVGESFLSHDKWKIKLLSEFLCKSQSTFYEVTLTQKIITYRVLKYSQMVLRGCVWVGEQFFKPWQVTDKIIGWIFLPIHIQHFMSNSNSKNNNS